MKNACYILLLSCLILIIISGTEITASAQYKVCDLIINNNQDAGIILKTEIADTYDLKTKGLMYRKTLEKNSGMLFVFSYERILNFWMKNTYIPLSIAYIDRNGIIKEIYDMKPLDISLTYPSRMPCLFALEVNRGWFKRNNISEGCRIILNGCLSKQN